MTNDTNVFEDISSSAEETIVSKDRFSALVLTLEEDLEALKKEDEEDILNKKTKKESPTLVGSKKDVKEIGDASSNEDSEEEFWDDHLKELKKLKKISTQSLVTIGDITWFLKTAIFDLMNEIPDEFSIKSLALYECMLKRIGSFSKDAFNEHLQALLDKKNEENNDLLLLIKKKKEEKKEGSESERQASIIRPFFSILNAAKAKKVSSESDIVSPKRIKLLKRISPLALPNYCLSNQVDDECHENLLRSGMKLT